MTSSSSTGPAFSRQFRPEMPAARTRVEVAALQTLLVALGLLMALASRRVERFRRQVTRDVLLEIRSADGARQQYRLHAATRRLTLPRRRVQHAEFLARQVLVVEQSRAAVFADEVGEHMLVR